MGPRRHRPWETLPTRVGDLTTHFAFHLVWPQVLRPEWIQLKILYLLSLIAATMLPSVAADAARSPAVVWTFNAEPWQSRDIRQPEQAREVWDTMHLVAALQGLVNRESPRLYIY